MTLLILDRALREKREFLSQSLLQRRTQLVMQGHVYLIQMPESLSYNVHLCCHINSNTTDLTCVITCGARLWPGEQHLSSRGQSNNRDVYCWKLHAAIWRHLKEQSGFQPSRRDLTYVSMCGRYDGLTDISRGSEMLRVWCAGRTRNCSPLFSPPTDIGGISQDRHKQGDMMSYEATSDCNLWAVITVSECSGKKTTKTLSTYKMYDIYWI